MATRRYVAIIKLAGYSPRALGVQICLSHQTISHLQLSIVTRFGGTIPYKAKHQEHQKVNI
jgi:hypothetical protein